MITYNSNCIELIKSFEGLVLQAYLDPVGIWTIGYGTIQYPDGRKVRKGDSVTKEQALELLIDEINQKARRIDPLLREDLNENQFGALISFAYNVGEGALKTSTLRMRVNNNPSDPLIRSAFMMWTKGRVDGKLVPLAGLKRRREAEANLYFKP